MINIMNSPVQLMTTKPDTELAKDHRDLIVEAAKPLMEALTNARKDGFVTQLNFGEDAFQRITIQSFNLFKSF